MFTPRPILTRCVAGLLAAATAYTSVGVVLLPVDVRVATGDAYPCQGGSCGCQSAAQCWQNCCCHTDSEKVAWAQAHGVVPPAFVVERAKLETKAAKPACCRHCTSAPTRKPATPATLTNPATTKAKAPGGFRVATVSALRTCGGYESHRAALLHRICQKSPRWCLRLRPSAWTRGDARLVWDNVLAPPTPPPPQRSS